MFHSAHRQSATKKPQAGPQVHRHPVILRASSLVVAAVLSLLMLTAVVPPIVADQSDRAVVDAPIMLLTAPIDGEVDTVQMNPGGLVQAGETLARIINVRLDRGTLISMQEKIADAREKRDATQAKKNADRAYLTSLDAEIASQTDQLKAQFESQIVELTARVAESESLSGEKKALVDRQSNMVARNAASMDMLRPTNQQYSASLHKSDAEKARLNQKIAQLNALQKGIFVGDDLVAIANLAQKRRDIDLDAQRMGIEEKELAAVLQDQQHLITTEGTRLQALAAGVVQAPGQGTILNVGVAAGRHVNAGDAMASLVDCDKRFVVAIFSYRQGQSMKVGTPVRVEGGSFGSGVVTAVLPKTSDKIDERFAVPFPQTERRELYAMIAPDNQSNDAVQPQAAAAAELSPSCAVGQWVTVTKNNGIVPSMSVAWRRLETLLTSWGNDQHRIHPGDDGERRRQAGIAKLAAEFHSKFRSADQFELENWMPRTDAVVSR